ncbi:MAG: tryptophan-rich sensory protein [Alphaproteobacteria bacterium]|nr:tryptophan-rich sensory protein [Alphaproteobacteria bacterium]
MNQIASRGQLRMSYLRWALFTVPLILFLGIASGRVAGSGYGNRWFASLAKPELMPPGWVFGIVWPILYLLLGFALAMILHARGAHMRWPAIILFVTQLILNFIWSPLFFTAHQVTNAFYLMLGISGLTVLTIILFAVVRKAAAILLLPYLLWLGFAAYLTLEIDLLNPAAETLVAPAMRTQI